MKSPSLRDLRDAIDKDSDMLPGVSPPALVEYLLAADRYVLDVLTHPYAAPAMCVDATTSSANGRSGGAIFAPGTTHGRLWLTRTGSGLQGNAAQAGATFSNTSSGATAADEIVVPAYVKGVAGYLDVSAGLRYVGTFESGDQIDDTPAAAMERQAEIAEQLTPAVEDFIVETVDGVTFYPSIQSLDLEAL